MILCGKDICIFISLFCLKLKKMMRYIVKILIKVCKFLINFIYLNWWMKGLDFIFGIKCLDRDYIYGV